MTTKKKPGKNLDTFRLPPLNLDRINGGGGGGGTGSRGGCYGGGAGAVTGAGGGGFGGGNSAYKPRRNGTCTARESTLLGDLHVDKLYLQKLLENPGSSIQIPIYQWLKLIGNDLY